MVNVWNEQSGAQIGGAQIEKGHNVDDEAKFFVRQERV